MDFDSVAAALRQDAADLTTYATVLLRTLGDALPPGYVTVTRERGLFRRREEIKELSVRLGDRLLTLTAARGAPVAEIRHEVRGVILSRDRVAMDAWIDALAQALLAQADTDARAAEALRRLLAGS